MKIHGNISGRETDFEHSSIRSRFQLLRYHQNCTGQWFPSCLVWHTQNIVVVRMLRSTQIHLHRRTQTRRMVGQ